jgi:AraC-like DNA-binding protein
MSVLLKPKSMKTVPDKEVTVKHDYNYSNFQDWLDAFSLKLDTPFENNYIEFPEYFGKGHIQVGQIMDGLTYRLVDYILNQDFEICFKPSNDFSVHIHFYKYISNSPIVLQLGESLTVNEESTFKMSSINSSKVPLKRVLKKGTYVRGASIELSEDWIINNLKNSNPDNYNKLVNTSHLIYILTAKQEKLLDNIFDKTKETNVPSVFVSGRLLRLLEIFLDNMFTPHARNELSISTSDIQKMLKVEAILLEKYKDTFPNISKLARLTGMSESKLKRTFKAAFGTGMFEYYQRNKMHKAKELINSGKYNISEIGNMLGYVNLSNFSSAFKKEFSVLPKHFSE